MSDDGGMQMDDDFGNEEYEENAEYVYKRFGRDSSSLLQRLYLIYAQLQ